MEHLCLPKDPRVGYAEKVSLGSDDENVALKKNSVWHNFSGFLLTSIYHERCPFAACFTWISLGCSPALSHLLSCSSLNYKYLELGRSDLVDLWSQVTFTHTRVLLYAFKPQYLPHATSMLIFFPWWCFSHSVSIELFSLHLPAPSGPPENFEVKPLRGKGTAVKATWDPPEEPNGRIKGITNLCFKCLHCSWSVVAQSDGGWVEKWRVLVPSPSAEGAWKVGWVVEEGTRTPSEPCWGTLEQGLNCCAGLYIDKTF